MATEYTEEHEISASFSPGLRGYRDNRPARLARGLCALAVLALSACSQLRYYHQSAAGQLDIVDRRIPVDDIIDDESRAPRLRSRLSLASQMRLFAINELGLPDTGSYTYYADLERDYAVLNLFAAPEFSTALKQWCYPLIGCAAYRGYFDSAQLQAEVAVVREQGYDTYVGLVPAYSTLGWFDDPLLNTVIDWPEPQLAGLIFHELAHQQLYVKGDTVFNESFASAVEQAGVERWLAAADAEQVERYRRLLNHRRRAIELIADTRSRLAELYQSALDETAMRSAKRDELASSRQRYLALRAGWSEDAGFDAWFAGQLNNARLGSVAAYNDYVGAFLQLLADAQGDFEVFYARAAHLAALDEEQRVQQLQALSERNVECTYRTLAD